VTINKCFKKLEIMKDRLIPRCVLDKYAWIFIGVNNSKLK
jgi:hypothetical protein